MKSLCKKSFWVSVVERYMGESVQEEFLGEKCARRVSG